MIVFVVLKEVGRFDYEECVTSILGVFHTRSQAINAAREDCGERGPENCDRWAHIAHVVDSRHYKAYNVSRHLVPKAAFTKIVIGKAKR